jgi:SAM-dependent methyltransferase
MYGGDLAFIHHLGFGDWARRAAPAVIDIIKHRHPGGVVVDLGCGSGVLSAELLRTGYRVRGVDISEDMIRLARQQAPKAEFTVGSLFDIELGAPASCAAVLAVGEPLNYLVEGGGGSGPALQSLFRRVFKALQPGGALIFDIAQPGQVPEPEGHRGYALADDWAILFHTAENAATEMLTRRMTTFRMNPDGRTWRRSDEVHVQRLYRAGKLLRDLRAIGFRARIMAGYGSGFRLPGNRRVVVARKPG